MPGGPLPRLLDAYRDADGVTALTQADASEYVVNEADSLPAEDVEGRLREFTWQLIGIQVEDFIARYSEQKIGIDKDFDLQPEREEVLRALLKYGGVIAHTVKLYRYLKDAYKDQPSEVELSVDETESVTSPFEHFLVANELRQHEVQLVSLAPRFVGDFEKGIDYKGDVEQFKTEYIKHLKIAEMSINFNHINEESAQFQS